MKRALAALAAAVLATGAAAQDPGPDARVIGAMGDRLLVRDGERTHLCALRREGQVAVMTDCIEIVAQVPDCGGPQAGCGGPGLQSGEAAPAPASSTDRDMRQSARERARNLSDDAVLQALRVGFSALDCDIRLGGGEEKALVLATARAAGFSQQETEFVERIMARRIEGVMPLLKASGQLNVNEQAGAASLEGCIPGQGSPSR